MTDPNRQNDDPVNPAQAGEPVVSKPYIMPDDPLEGSTEALAKEAAELRDKVLRTLAEMENLRKRTTREVADARVYAISGFARDVLDIADNLQRALDAVPAEAKAAADPGLKALIEGVELTERSLLNTLEKNGVKKFDPSGEKFDPNFQQAMYEVPDPSVPAGTVVPGRAGRLHDRRARVAAGAGRGLQGRRQGQRFRTELNRDIARLDALDAGLGHVRPGFGQRALGVDAAAGVFDHIGLEAGLARIERGPGDAEIRGQSGDEQALQLAGLEIGGKSGRGFAVGLGESGIAVDVLVESLANDEFGLRNREVLRKRGAVGALHAVIGPQHLLAVCEIDGFERLFAGMDGCERDMARRYASPASSRHWRSPLAMRLITGNDLLAVLHGEAAAGQEAVLDIDHQKRRCVIGLDRSRRPKLF